MALRKVDDSHQDFYNIQSRTTEYERSTHRVHQGRPADEEIYDVKEFDTWRKIRVHEDKVSIEKEFYHDRKPGSQLFVSQRNDLLTEFDSGWCYMYFIKADN